MQKILKLTSRVVIMSVFVAFSIGLVYGEALVLSSKNSKSMAFKAPGKVLAKSNLVISNPSDNVLGMSVDSQIIKDDARPLIIKRYLEKYNSPLAPYANLIYELSNSYGFEYYWIVAIAQQESNLCKKAPEGSHNCWGYGIHKKGSLGFDSYELALKSYAEYLDREYFKKGLNTPELIMKKYCPSSNGSWAFGVSHFIAELQSGNF